MSGLTARLGRVKFTGARFRWEPGIYIVTLDGIDGGGTTSYERIPRGFGVGVHDSSNRRDAPRIITQTGFIYALNDTDLDNRIDQLGGLLAEDDETGTYWWNRRGSARRATVRRESFPPPRRRRGELAFADYTLVLRAADQRIYGEPLPPTAWENTASVQHRGQYPAPVVVEVRGNKPGGYTIIGPRGARAVIERPLTTGSVHRYDAETGLLMVDGVAQTEGVTRSDRMEIPHGPWQFSVDPGCELRVMFSPTWAP